MPHTTSPDVLRTSPFWWRFLALAVPMLAYAVLNRPGAEPSDGSVVLALMPLVIAMFWVTYPEWSRFLQIEPTRMSLAEFTMGGFAIAAQGVVLGGSGVPLLIAVPLVLGGSAVLAALSVVLIERARQGDTTTSFFSD